MAESRPGGDAPAPAPSLLRGYGRGVAWTYLSLVLTGASTFFLAAWTIRRVGTAEFGQLALVTSLAGLLTIFDYALGLAVQRASARVEAGRDEERAAVHAAHGAYVVLGLAAAALTAVAFGVTVVAAPARMPHLAATVALFGLATALQVGTAALPAVAVGCRRFSLRSGATLAGLGVRVAVALLTVGHLGVAGLGLGQLLGVGVDRLVLLRLLRRRVPWFLARPSPPDRTALRGVIAFSVPLVVLNASGQLFAVSDLMAVGALVGAAAVGIYQVGALLPMQLGGFLMIGYDVAFPALSGSDDPASQESATGFLTRLFAFIGGTGLALAALLRSEVVQLLLGRPSTLAGNVLAIFCGIGMANLIVHGLVSLLIARGHQALMARVVAIELPVNVMLTVWFVLAFGAVGAAVATLATVLLMNFVVFPVISRDCFARPVLATVVRDGLVPAALGGAVAVAAARVALLAGPPAARLTLGAVVAGALAVGSGLRLLGPSGRRALRDAVAADRPGLIDAAPAVAL